MSFPYKRVLVVGATSGIGLELAKRLIGEGVATIAVGRRQERLDQFVAETKSNQAAGLAFDISDIAKIPSFAERVIKKYPDLDCVFLNAGVQYVMDFSKPHTVDMAKVQNEIAVNYTAMVGLTHAFMPFFLGKKQANPAFLYTTTSLESIPYPMVLNYSASKAALRSFILSVREQLKYSGQSHVHLGELYTPLVQTELHNSQPGWTDDFNPGMPVADFVTAALDGFRAKQETVAVGVAKGIWDEFEESRGKRVGPQWEMVRKAMGKAHVLE